MDMYTQIQYSNEQMMMYQAMQAMQLQQQAYMYDSYMQEQPQQTQDQKSSKSGKRSYVQCDLWKRQTLVEKVDKEGLTIKDAAKELDINYSTAKHIMKVFRQTGEVETKIMMKRKTKETGSEPNCDMNMDVQPQIPMEAYQQMQPTYYDMGFNQCQLPIDLNMQDVNFQATSFEEEEKEQMHAFFFQAQDSQ